MTATVDAPARNNDAPIATAAALLLSAAIGALFWFTDLDLRLQGLAYRPAEPNWPYGARQPWVFLHDYGTWPGLFVTLAAILIVALSFIRDSARRWRYPALFIFLFVALGPGVLTNLVGKMLYGRPRPFEILQFGGSLPFHRPFEFGRPGSGFSFLCGHCSMGYLFFTFFFLLRGARRWIALAGGVLFGLLIGVGRVLQAGHFPSDVLLDGTLMFAVAAALSPIAGRQPQKVAIAGWKVAFISAIVAALTVVSFLFSTPVHNEWSFLWVRPGEQRHPATRQEVFEWHGPQEISFAAQTGNVAVEIQPQADPLLIEALVKGFGFPRAGSENDELQTGRILSFDDHLTGLYWEVHGSFGIRLAENAAAHLLVRMGDGEVTLDARRTQRPLEIGGRFALVDRSKRLSRNGNGWARPGVGEPVIVSVEAHRLIIR